MGNNCVLGQRERIVSGCNVRQELERVGIVLTWLLFTVFSFVQRSFLAWQLSQAVVQRLIKITESTLFGLSLAHRNHQVNGPLSSEYKASHWSRIQLKQINARGGLLNVGRKLFRWSNPKSKSILALSLCFSCAICQLIVSQRCQ